MREFTAIWKSRFVVKKYIICVDFIHRGLFTLYFDEKSSYLLFGADCQTEVTAAGFQDL